MRTSYGKISKVKLDKTELNMKDLDEKFKRKSYTHLKSDIYIFYSINSICPRATSCLFLNFTLRNF